MDLENKPNMQGTRIGGGYMVVVYGSGGGSGGSIWIWIGGGIWIRIGGGIWIRIQSVVVGGRGRCNRKFNKAKY